VAGAIRLTPILGGAAGPEEIQNPGCPRLRGDPELLSTFLLTRAAACRSLAGEVWKCTTPLTCCRPGWQPTLQGGGKNR